MADEIKLNQDQFNAIITKLDSIDNTLDALYKYYKEFEKNKEELEAVKLGFQINKEFMINDYLNSMYPNVNGYYPLEFAKMLALEYPSSNNDTSKSNDSIKNEKLDELIKEISNSSKDDRNSFNMLVNTLKDSNSKQELKELKSLTIATNDLLVKQVNSQNQANAISLIFSISLFACLGIGFCVKTFTKMF